MPQTIECKQCRAILNLPVSIKPGKRLKCPRCGLRFTVSVRDASSESTAPGIYDAASSHSMNVIQSKGPRGVDLDDLPIPVAEGDLRETFDLPLLGESEGHSGRGGGHRALADASALFQEAPRSRRKVAAAEARRSARRCMQCGGLVPQGMSICSVCGVDQETGARIDLMDDLAPPPPPPPAGPPVHVLLVGGLSLTVGIILAVLSAAQTVQATSQLATMAWLALALVALFSILASIEFIRGRSTRLLLTAIAVGAVANVLSLITLPILEASFQEPEKIITQAKSDDIEDEDTAIRPFEERIDTRRLALGIVMLAASAVLTVYLMSPPVKRFIHQQALARAESEDY